MGEETEERGRAGEWFLTCHGANRGQASFLQRDQIGGVPQAWRRFSIARTSQKCRGSLPDRADRLASLSESQKEGKE